MYVFVVGDKVSFMASNSAYSYAWRILGYCEPHFLAH